MSTDSSNPILILWVMHLFMTYNIHCTRNFNFNNIFSSNNFYLNKKFENYAKFENYLKFEFEFENLIFKAISRQNCHVFNVFLCTKLSSCLLLSLHHKSRTPISSTMLALFSKTQFSSAWWQKELLVNKNTPVKVEVLKQLYSSKSENIQDLHNWI